MVLLLFLSYEIVGFKGIKMLPAVLKLLMKYLQCSELGPIVKASQTSVGSTVQLTGRSCS